MFDYLDYRTENDVQIMVSPTKPETERPVKYGECLYCDRLGACRMIEKPCTSRDDFRFCGLPE